MVELDLPRFVDGLLDPENTVNMTPEERLQAEDVARFYDIIANWDDISRAQELSTDAYVRMLENIDFLAEHVIEFADMSQRIEKMMCLVRRIPQKRRLL